MGLRRPSIGNLERAIRDTRERIEQEEAERRQHEELASQAEQEKRNVADDVTAFNEATQTARNHRDQVERLGLVLERRAKELSELEASLGLAKYENDRAAQATALNRQHEDSKKVASAIAALDRAVVALTAARDEVDSATAAARASCPSDMDFELAGPDEPDWPDGLERLVEALQNGPKRPLAAEAKGRARVAAESESAARSEVAQVVREALMDGWFARVENLRGNRRQLVDEIAEGQAKKLLAEIPGPPSGELDMSATALQRAREQKRKTIERRLARLRELASRDEQLEAAA